MVMGANKSRRWLSFYAPALALLVIVLVGILLVWGNGDLRSPEAKFAIGLNLFASAIFALVFASLSSWVASQIQNATLQDSLYDFKDEILRRISDRDARYLPFEQFPASDSFDEAFNRSLMTSIEGSGTYDFCGPSARFVAARLRMVRNCPQSIRIAMIDPGMSAAVTRRAADRQAWLSSEDKKHEELEKEFRDELMMTIVSLFDLRNTVPVRIVYTSDMVVYRMELTDDSVFFSWYHGDSSSGREMPESAKFGAESLYFNVLRREMTRRFEILPKQIVFDSSKNDSDLLNHLRAISGMSLTPAEIQIWREKHPAYTNSFTRFLESLGYGKRSTL